MYVLYQRMPGVWLPEEYRLFVFVFTAFAALRLAKFNIDDTQRASSAGFAGYAASALRLARPAGRGQRTDAPPRWCWPWQWSWGC